MRLTDSSRCAREGLMARRLIFERWIEKAARRKLASPRRIFRLMMGPRVSPASCINPSQRPPSGADRHPPATQALVCAQSFAVHQVVGIDRGDVDERRLHRDLRRRGDGERHR
jgi:hypothetical protein